MNLTFAQHALSPAGSTTTTTLELSPSVPRRTGCKGTPLDVSDVARSSPEEAPRGAVGGVATGVWSAEPALDTLLAVLERCRFFLASFSRRRLSASTRSRATFVRFAN